MGNQLGKPMANCEGGCAAHPQGSSQRPVGLEWEPPPAGPGSDCSPGAFGPWKVALIGGAHLCCSQGGLLVSRANGAVALRVQRGSGCC